MDETKLGVRVAILEGGRVVHERAADDAARLTLADLGLRTDGSRSHVLFSKEPSGWVLCLPAGASGQLNARPEQAARALDGAAPIRLGPADKGRLHLDGQTVLFQLATPSSRLALALPRLDAGPWWSRFDAPFAGLVAAFLLIEGGGAVALAQRELKKEDISFESLPERWVRVAAKPPEPKKPAALKPAPETKPAPKPQVAAAEPEHKPAPRLTGAALHDQLKNVGVLHVLSALDANTRAAMAAAVGPKGFQQTAAEALDHATHVGTQTGDQTIDRKDTGPIVTEIGPVKTEVDALPTGPTGPIVHKQPTGPMITLPKEPPGSLDQQQVAQFVRGHLGSLKACYEAELKRNHELGGRLKVRFTVLQAGDFTDAEIEEDGLHSLAVSSCITRRIEAWHLPAHVSEEITVSFPFIFAHE